MESKKVFTLKDLETELVSIDKSTIFRTLNLFEKHFLIHSIDDGTGSQKYSICDDNCTCKIDQLHVHFLCTHCNKTFCLREIPIPFVMLPDGFTYESANYVIKGVCKECRKIAT